jgi:hypothetical protein
MVTHEGISGWIKEWVADMVRDYSSFDELLCQGYCADLATLLWEAFGRHESIIFHSCDYPCHVWIEFNGRHYDMQNPDGVDTWKAMDYFQEFPEAVLES